jgi:2-methylisocitrate lyase-like PEP mutase family enzyme
MLTHREHSYGEKLRWEMGKGEQIAFMGVYDIFSATLAAKYSDNIFISGFGFAASYYGLPDIGFISWSDMVQFVQRVRTVLPEHHLLVDIDDGYGDTEVACHVVSLLERIGVSAVMLEDQQRPRRCGHFDGKHLMEVDAYVAKLRKVLDTRKDLVVIARTDATEIDDITRRIEAFADAGADAVLVDGLRDLNTIKELSSRVKAPFTFNQIAGGKSPACTMRELQDVGVSLVIYSTPCLFAAQTAIEDAIQAITANGGKLPAVNSENGNIGVKDCTAVLSENLARRDGKNTSSSSVKAVPGAQADLLNIGEHSNLIQLHSNGN